MNLIKDFREISKSDTIIAGGKGASLGEMTQAGIPVPPGFVVLSAAFDRFIEETDLNVEIDAALDEVNIKEVHTLENASEKIQAMIISKETPDDIKEDVLKYFKALDSKFVAVRSSATSEDSASAAWAGQLDSFLNTTKETLLENVKKCWASLFTPRAIFYRFEKKLEKDKISVAVVVQKMIQSEESGIAFSVHPVTQDENQIIIEAGFGLGEAIVSGSITPDSYVIDKQGFNILDINVNEQSKALFKQSNGGNEWKELGEKGKKQVLSEKEITELSKLIVKIENHYGFPCDIEWAKEKGKFYIVQSRPITTLNKTKKESNTIKLVLGNQDIDTSMLTLEMTWRGMNDKKIKSQVGFKTPLFSCEIINGRTINGYINPKEFKTFVGRCVKRILVDKNLLKHLKQKSEEFASKVQNIALENISKIDEMNNDSFANLLEKMQQYQKELSSYGTVVAFVDVFGEFSNKTSEIINSRKNLKYPSHIYTQVLCNPEIRSLTEQAYSDIKTSKGSEEKLIEKYFWLDQGYIGRGISKKEIKDIKKWQLKEEILPKKEILLKELSLTEKEKDILNISKQLIYIKSLRADSRQFIHVVVNRIIDKLSKEWNEPVLNLESLTADEVIGILKQKMQIPLELNSRVEHSIFTIEKEGYKILKGKEANVFIEENILKEELKDVKEITGQVANPGKVKGKVKLIFGPQHSNKVQEGDILVSTVTSPQLLPAMKKSAAFVTDLGGITSHAAIVSRELNKPCIVGTEIATQILSDGDLVEVDANNGVVKILKKANGSPCDIELAKEEGKSKISNLKNNFYILHTSVSGFSLLLFDLMLNIKTYGAVDYRVLCENDISLMYLTKKGMKQAYQLSKKLLNNNLFTKIFNDSKKLNDNLKAYKPSNLNGKNIIEEWEKYVKLVNEFCRLYRFYEQPFQQALEENVLSYIPEQKLMEYLSNSNKKQTKNINISSEGKVALDRLIKLGNMKLELHKNAARLVTIDLMKFVKFVAQKNSISIQVAQSLRNNEFMDAMTGKPANIRLAKERLNGCALVKRNNSWYFDSGDKYLYWKNKIQKTQSKKIIGNIAFPGKVRGKVVLHLSWTDTTKLSKGDILVTGMTNPQMIPFIKNAGAIITDEGGITCHAAIISREMRKPCITGTKNATQLLKDGDLVEVDANKGTVTILKKANGFTSDIELAKEKGKSSIVQSRPRTTMDKISKDQRIFKIEKNSNYFPVVSRKLSLLHKSIGVLGITDSNIYQRIFGFPTRYKPFYDSQQGLYFNRKSVEYEKKEILKKISKDPKYLEKISKKCECDGDKLLDFSKQIKKTDFSKKTDAQIKNITQKIFKSYIEYTAYIMPILSVQEYLEKNIRKNIEKTIKNKKQIEKYLHILTVPIKNNFGYFEQIEILKLANFYKNNKNKIIPALKRKIDRYLFEFSSIGVKYGIGKLWTEKSVIERIIYLSKKYPDKKLKHLQDFPKLQQEKIDYVLKELKANKNFRKFVKIARIYIYLRTYRTDIISNALANMFPLFGEIAKRNNAELEDILKCLSKEIISFDIPDREFLNMRNKTILIRSINGRMYYIYGKEAEELTNNLKKSVGLYNEKDQVNKKINSLIKGSAANIGKVKGEVKIVLDNSQLDNVFDGDILVASMTTPDFVPAMEKASAFITDEGGILCHAAIVSREMNKPCIIGTKVATKVLKDGDLVEVDADKGTVTILKKANGSPCDIELAKEKGKSSIVQSRPRSTLKNKDLKNKDQEIFQIIRDREIMLAPVYWVPMSITSLGAKRIYGIINKNTYQIYKNGRMKAVFIKNEVDQIRECIVSKILDDNNYFNRIRKQIENRENKLNNYFKYFKSINLSDLSLHKIIGLIRRMEKVYIDYEDSNISAWFIAADKFQAELEKELNISEKDFLLLLTPKTKTAVNQLEFDLNKYFKQIKTNKLELKTAARKLSEDFGWLPFGFDGPEYWDAKYFENKLEAMFRANEKKILSKFNTMQKEENEIVIQQKALIIKYGLNKNKQHLIDIMNYIIVLTDKRKRLVVQTYYYYSLILKELEKRYDVPYTNLKYLFADELYLLDEHKQKILQLSNNRRNNEFVVLYQKGKYTILSKKAQKQFLKKLTKQSTSSVINGMVASQGPKKKYKGTVKILLSPKEVGKIKKGDFLVATMTTPDYITAMHRAGGFITDEGGVTCHAAITAREMNKPCIIGTKVATKVLKDGDLVEVDANKGTVKKINKTMR